MIRGSAALVAVLALWAPASARAEETADQLLDHILAEAPSYPPGMFGGVTRKALPPPKRIVTVAPSATELVIALGATSRLVGVSRFDEQEAVRALPRVGGFVDPNVEAILAARPDLVIGVPNAGAKPALERLAKLGVPVLVVPGNTFQDIFYAMRAVADALGGDAPERAQKLLERMEHDVRELARAAKKESAPRVAFVYGWTPLVLAGPGSFADTMLRLLHAKNVASTGPAYPQYAVEKLIEAQPEVIIDASQMAAEGSTDTPWTRYTTIPAVKTNRVHRLRADEVLVPAPRLVEGMKKLAALLHPR